MVFRRRTAVFLGTGAVIVALAVTAAVAVSILRTRALSEPTFEVLLVQAPR